MDLSADLALSARRHDMKQAIAAVLAKFDLPVADRRAVLLDLAMDGSSSAGSIAATTSTPTGPAAAIQARKRTRRGRPMRHRGTANDAGRTDTLLAALKASPGISVGDLAAKVYPDVNLSAAKGRTRSLLSALKASGRVRNPESGRWEVIPEKA
ncbi:MAG: hypothetical protein ABTD50_00025 [Polyangiaceae bacterium]|jgi:hypothetical protein